MGACGDDFFFVVIAIRFLSASVEPVRLHRGRSSTSANLPRHASGRPGQVSRHVGLDHVTGHVTGGDIDCAGRS